MATKRISELQLRSDFDATCNVPVDDTSQSYRTTGQQLRNYIAPLTTIGDILYATTSGVAARLAIGSAQQALKAVAGVPAWAWPLAVQRAATTTDAISATTDHILLYNATSGAFTATLPTAASVAGKTYILKKTDSSLNAVTIATTSSQTIDGVVGSALHTQYETLVVFSDGSNWLVLDRRIPSIWVGYTPTFTGFGTVSAVSFFSRRVGANLEINGVFTCGTSTAVQAQITLGFNGTNANVTSAGSAAIGTAGFVVGSGYYTTAGAVTFVPIALQSVGYLTFGGAFAGTVGFNALNGNALLSTGQTMSFNARVPITGWNG